MEKLGVLNKLLKKASSFLIDDTLKKNEVLFSVHTTDICNYRCPYCISDSHLPGAKKPLRMRGRDIPIFHAASPEEWTKRFQEIAPGKKSFHFSGGEPFFDIENFIDLLSGVSKLPEVRYIRIDTNGSWDVNKVREIDTSKIALNVSFHPTQTDLESWISRVNKIRKRGFKVITATFILAVDQRQFFSEAFSRLKEHGILLIPGVDLKYLSKNNSEELKIEKDYYSKFLSDCDLDFILGSRKTKDRPCYRPMLTYLIKGSQICIDCLYEWSEIFEEDPPKLSKKPVPCPKEVCQCPSKYSMLVDFPKQERMEAGIIIESYAKDFLKHSS